MSKKKLNNTPTLLNRRARHDFEILDTLQAGVSLCGTEVKSLRAGRGQITQGFVKIDRDLQAWLHGAVIPVYEHGNRHNHTPERTRKLLLTKRELRRWKSRIDQEKLTAIPLKLYFRRSWVKLEIALAKRKLQHDKRKELRKKAIDRDVRREVSGY